MKLVEILAWPFKQVKLGVIAIINFLKDLLNQESTVSSMRFWRLIIILNITTEWQYAIWFGNGTWDPSAIAVTFAAAVLGLSMFQKGMELNNGTNTHVKITNQTS